VAPKLFIFRVDASQEIGTGHAMRCLALADVLRGVGVTVKFVTRSHLGDMNEYIRSKGFHVSLLPSSNIEDELSGYDKWLGVKKEDDARETIRLISGSEVDWLVVDHYALDVEWENMLRPYVHRIMAIDDLANRVHDCDVLLDQNYINHQQRYDKLLPPEAIRLLGPEYALLRNEFGNYDQQIRFKSRASINKIFVFFGGADLDNLTVTTLKALCRDSLNYLNIDVVVGLSNCHLTEVQALADKKSNVQLHIQSENIAELMDNADLAFGAGGITTWERMAIGLPSIVVTVADNQVAFTKDLHSDGYIQWIGHADQIAEADIYSSLMNALKNEKRMHEQSLKGKGLVDGKGAYKVADILTVEQ